MRSRAQFGARRGQAGLWAAVACAAALTPGAMGQYCAVSAESCSQMTNDERISRVVFNTIDNTSGMGDGGGGSAVCYSDFTALSTQVAVGQTYAITVYNAGPYAPGGDAAAVWIDWNHDTVFGDEASGEQVTLMSVDGYNTFTGSVTVPAGAMLGATRMRVNLLWTGDGSPLAPCGDAGYGEAEDYTVVVMVPTTGACCGANGACTSTAPASCTPSSNYQGDGTSCTPSNPCGGACCDAAGACTVTLAAGCAGTSGFRNHDVCSPSPCVYCAAGSGSCAVSAQTERISRVVMAGIDNTSGNGDGPAGCYSNFIAVSTMVMPGQSYPITVYNAQPFFGDQAAVWIDWNHDFAFGDAASGEQYTLSSVDNGATFTGSVLVPALAKSGATRMRVRLTFSGAVPACGNTVFGEVEDYTVTVPSSATGACCTSSGCAGGVSQAACVLVNSGVYGGDGSACSPGGSVVCSPVGRCCVGASCSITFQATCTAGDWLAGAGCSAGNPCVHDECTTAGTLVLGTPVQGTTAGATQSVTSSCSFSMKDVWFSFTAPASGGYGFTVIVQPGSPTQLVPAVAIFSTCPAVSGANDAAPDGCQAQAQGPSNFVKRSNMPAGQTVWVRIADFNTDNTAFIIEADAVLSGACCHPTSGACTSSNGGAPGCPPGTAYQGNGTVCSAAQCAQGSCCDDSSGGCALSTAAGCAAGHTFRAVGTTCASPCLGTACCNPTVGSCTFVGAMGMCPSGTVSQGSGTSCQPGVCAQPPAGNDLCTMAQALTLNVAFQGSTALATGDGTEGPPGACYTPAEPLFSHAVWFSFTAPATTSYLVSSCGSTFDTVLSVFSGPDCANLTEIACDDDTCAGSGDDPSPGPGPGSGLASVVSSVPMTAGATYLVRLAGWSTTPGGPYGVVVRYAAGVTVASCCVGPACTLTDSSHCAGMYGASGSCSPSPCMVVSNGTCCDPMTGGCTFVPSASCPAGSTFDATGTGCGPPNPCAQPGNCCDAGTGGCMFVLAANCPAGSSFNAAGTGCGPPNPCAQPGNCCNSGTGGCTFVLAASCPAGSSFDPAGTGCGPPNPCPQPGTCCDPNTGGCTFVLAPNCLAGGTFNAAGTGCGPPNPCPQPGTCCNSGTGGCTFVLAANCPAGSSFDAAGAGCGPPNPCPQPGTCCDSGTGGCTYVLASNCPAGSTFNPAGTGCGPPNPCPPPPGACCSGSTCLLVADAAACAALNPTSVPPGAFTRFTAAGQACNAPGNSFTPCCKADFNQSGEKSIQDLFDFLAAWFAKTPQSDINGNPPCTDAPSCGAGVTVQDLFDFLAAWFSGC